jgi:twitching motility protein PilT
VSSLCRLPPGVRAGHRAHGVGEVDHPGQPGRPGQPGARGPHHDRGGPHRVPPHPQRCLVNQREVGEDTKSFASALKHVLRQDPDIILVGELRDLETISIALTAAETGHLVFATLHTQDAPQTVDRMIDVFPTNQQQQIRVQLAGALQGVVCQQLIPTADGNGRVVGVEIMMATPAIRNLIRDGKTHQIYSAMQAGGRHGMQTMDQHLADLVRRGYISYDKGLERCHHAEDYNRLCGRAA